MSTIEFYWYYWVQLKGSWFWPKNCIWKGKGLYIWAETSEWITQIPILQCLVWLLLIFFKFVFSDLIVSFDCTGEVGGTVELSMLLNYTKIQGSTVQSDTSKSFKLTVNKVCEKTGRYLVVLMPCFTSMLNWRTLPLLHQLCSSFILIAIVILQKSQPRHLLCPVVLLWGSVAELPCCFAWASVLYWCVDTRGSKENWEWNSRMTWNPRGKGKRGVGLLKNI